METVSFKYFTGETDFPFFIQYGQHDNDLSLHTHDEFSELTIVLSGTATHIVNGERYLIKKGDMFVIGDNISHGFENPHEFKICNIMYRLNDIFQPENDITSSAGFHALFVIEPYLVKDNKFKSRLQLTLSQFEIISTLIAGMINEYTNKEEGWKTVVKANFHYLIVLLSRAYQINSSSNEVVLNMVKPIVYIGKHLNETISVTELAKLTNMSPRHFTRMFHNIYNMSPMNYIIQCRIHYSFALLKNSSLAVSDIALKCGFNDSAYYARQFKKLTGFSPREYRKIMNIDDFE